MLEFPEREYTFSDSTLWLKVGNVAYSMERDEAEFITRGVPALDRQAFVAQGNAFEQLLPDSYYRARVSQAVATKTAAKEDTERLVQDVSGFVQQRFKLNSPEYKFLGIKGYQGMREREQVTAARQVAAVAEDLLADLTPIGLTQAKIDELTAAAQAYEDGLHLVSQREKERDEKTRARIVAGNELYAKLVEYCEIGKLIWENANPAYYNDYIIYRTVHHELPKVQNVQGSVIGGNQVELTFDLVTGALQYQVQWSEAPTGQPQGPFNEGQLVYGPPFSGPINPGFTNVYRVRAKNPEQSGAWSDELEVGA
jgi:hypothetical protein